MIKAISFDLDGTLADTTFDYLIWDEEIPRMYAEKHKLTLEQAKEKVYADYYKALYIEKEERWKDIAYWMERLKLGDWTELLERMEKEIKVYPDVMPALKAFQNKYLLIVVSGADKKFLDLKMKATGLKQFFKHAYSAPSNFRTAKKNVKMFLEILKEIELKPEELMHVGDDHNEDYLIPNTRGIHAFHLLRGRKRQGAHEITSLTELPEKIRELS